MPNRPDQEVALAAIKSFLKETGRTVGGLALRREKEPRPIYEIIEDEFQRLYYCMLGLRNRTILMVLKDTGGRITAILSAMFEDYRGDHIILQGGTVKNKNHFTEKSLCHPARRKLSMTFEPLNKQDRQPSSFFHYAYGGGGLA
jgi:integrase